MTDQTSDEPVESPAADGPLTDEGPRAAPLLLQTLICPVTRGPLTYDKATQELISKKAGLAFPIREGVPIMLEDEARALDDTEQ